MISNSKVSPLGLQQNATQISSLTKYFVDLARLGLGPILFFLAFFFMLTYPAATRFSTHFFADSGDGLQNVWNLWWVRKAITELHQWPWHTNYLHYPYGSTLLGHTLNPFNGFVAILLTKFTSLVQAHNLIVTFSFVIGGLTAFLLAHYLTHAYWPSMMAGFIFTFSNYHFAHAQGHLQLVSLEWIPLFVLLWLKLMSRPRIIVGAGAAFTLFLVILCDYYYFFYCVLTGLIIFGWFLRHRKDAFLFARREYAISLGTFGIVALATSGVLAGLFLVSNFRDPFVGEHSPKEFSLDLLAPVIYGGHWRFASLTSAYWTRLPGNIHESSVHLGLSVIFLLIYAWRKRRVADHDEIRLVFLLLFFFVVMALGPNLHIAGKRVAGLGLPYAWLRVVFPPIRLSGVPVRMTVMVMLAAGVICAWGLERMIRGAKRGKILAMALVTLLVLEYLPAPIPTTRVAIPGYVDVLKQLPGSEGVLDTVSPPAMGLFYQTLHEKPLALGYLARHPKSVDQKDKELAVLFQNESFDRLWRDYKLRYVVSEDASQRLRNSRGARIVWSDGKIWLFDVSGLESRRSLQKEAQK